MRVPVHTPGSVGFHDRTWLRFSFAAAVSLLAIVVDLVLDHYSQVHPFLPALAAVIAAVLWAGEGPGLAATAVLVFWSVFDLARHGFPASSTFVRCAVFLGEGVLLCVGSSRIWGSLREAAVREKRYRQILDGAPEGIWIHDDEGVIAYANSRIAGMLGLGVEELTGRRVEEFFPPADLSMERVRSANVWNGLSQQFDRRLRRPDGSELWALTCSSRISGRRPQLLSLMTDITERKRAEHALRHSEERFRNLFEGILEGVYQSTPDGRILAANPMLLQMLGVTNEVELKELDIARDFYVDPQVRKRLLERLDREGGIQSVEYELRRRDGQIITVLENARVVRDETGAVLHYEGTLTDITSRKRREERLLHWREMEALGRLASGIAADFNDVLTVITGSAQLALSALPPLHPARSSTEQVIHAAGRAMTLTRRLLSFSRGKDETADLNRAIEFEAAAQPGTVAALSVEPVAVYASGEHIEQIIRELSDHLRRSFPSSRLELKTEITKVSGGQTENHAVLSVRVSDDKPEPELPAEPLFRPVTADECAGHGLSRVHALVAQCGGSLARSVCRNGNPAVTGWRVILPLAADKPETARDAAGDSEGHTILLVEDEPLIRELSRDTLERQGYRVLLASGSREAEQIGGSAASFDLLITDVAMPNITGAELARRLRKLHPGLKVLFIAGYADDLPNGEAMGADGASFLQKPFSADSLGRKIRQMLNCSQVC